MIIFNSNLRFQEWSCAVCILKFCWKWHCPTSHRLKGTDCPHTMNHHSYYCSYLCLCRDWIKNPLWWNQISFHFRQSQDTWYHQLTVFVAHQEWGKKGEGVLGAPPAAWTYRMASKSPDPVLSLSFIKKESLSLILKGKSVSVHWILFSLTFTKVLEKQEVYQFSSGFN